MLGRPGSGLKLSEECLRQAPTRRWKKVRDEIRASVEDKGYDNKRGTFVRAFGSGELDAALLLLPRVEFIDYDDERMVRTTDAVQEELNDDGLLKRFRRDDGEEGALVACSFWLAECLARQAGTKMRGRSSTVRPLPETISDSSRKSPTRPTTSCSATFPRGYPISRTSPPRWRSPSMAVPNRERWSRWAVDETPRTDLYSRPLGGYGSRGEALYVFVTRSRTERDVIVHRHG